MTIEFNHLNSFRYAEKETIDGRNIVDVRFLFSLNYVRKYARDISAAYGQEILPKRRLLFLKFNL